MTLVFSGFAGVGKSHAFKTLTAMGYRVLDSDSSTFDKDNFPINYLNHIHSVIAKGEVQVLFVSSHDILRDAMRDDGIDYYLVYPALELKSEYLRRYISRGSNTAFIQLLENNWENWINDIEESGMDDDRLIRLENPNDSMLDVVQERL